MLARRGLYSIVGYGGTVTVPSTALVVGEMQVAGNLVGSWIERALELADEGSAERAKALVSSAAWAADAAQARAALEAAEQLGDGRNLSQKRGAGSGIGSHRAAISTQAHWQGNARGFGCFGCALAAANGTA